MFQIHYYLITFFSLKNVTYYLWWCLQYCTFNLKKNKKFSQQNHDTVTRTPCNDWRLMKMIVSVVSVLMAKTHYRLEQVVTTVIDICR